MDVGVIQRAYDREKKKSALAESLLENKSRELFLSYEQLKASHDELDNAHEALKHQQKQLIQSEKMASLGIISAGVAHEINNPIGFVLSNITTLGENVDVFTSLLKQLSGVFEKSHAGQSIDADMKFLEAYAKEEDIDFLIEDGEVLIKETIEGIFRVKDIVDGLKSFARSDSGELKDTDINDCITTTLTLLKSQTSYNCSVETDLGQLPALKCQSGKIKQVLMNLIVNASQALDSGGLISIGSRWENNAIYISVTDNGKGITEEQMDHLFTPFFTTKQVGEGTGLGLSISLGIVEEHGGSIEVTSELEKGTQFTVILPVLD
jgi:two-component system NtrC family sensor kinase